MKINYFLSFLRLFVCVHLNHFVWALAYKRIHCRDSGFKNGNCRIWYKVEMWIFRPFKGKSPPSPNDNNNIFILPFLPAMCTCGGWWNPFVPLFFSFYTGFLLLLFCKSVFVFCNSILNVQNQTVPAQMASFHSCLSRNIFRNFVSIFLLCCTSSAFSCMSQMSFWFGFKEWAEGKKRSVGSESEIYLHLDFELWTNKINGANYMLYIQRQTGANRRRKKRFRFSFRKRFHASGIRNIIVFLMER